MGKYNTHLEIDGVEDVPVTVHYVSCPFIAGSRDGRGGLKLEPDEPAHIEIESITMPDGRNYEPTTELSKRLEEEIGEWLDGMYDPPEPEGYHDAM